MKNLLILFLLIGQIVLGQDSKQPVVRNKKGSFYIYWGWNRSVYTKSDISFTGDNYNFTLDDVVAKDRQTPFAFNIYFNPKLVSLPQTNFRFAYFLKENLELSLGVDHMKYVMQRYQNVSIDGFINDSGTQYDGVYSKQDFVINEDFLVYEHTDGLNYVNLELRQFKKLFRYKNFQLNHTEGGGFGIMLPKTNSRLLNNFRHDNYHVSGFGLAAIFGLNIEFYQRFFLQGEIKAGYINMPDIRTTQFDADKASQQFSFLQSNILIGVNLNNRRVKSAKSQ
jgi:hypothetical protein